jgi:hypothetical protein
MEESPRDDELTDENPEDLEKQIITSNFDPDDLE